MRSLCTTTKNSTQRKPVCSNEDPVQPKRTLSWYQFPSDTGPPFSGALQQVPPGLFILSVSHSYLPAFSWTHTHRAVAQYDYMAAALLKIRMTFTLLYPTVAAQCFPHSISQQLWPLSRLSRTSHTHVLFLSLQPVHLVSFAGFGLFFLLKMVQFPRARFTTASVSYQHSLLRGSYPLPSQAHGFIHNSYIQWQLPNLQRQPNFLPKARLTDQTTWCPRESLTQTHPSKS